MRPTDRRVLIGAGAITALAIAVTGITFASTSDDDGPRAAPAASSAAPAPQRSAIQPGRPGESAQVVLPTPPPPGAEAPGATDPWNQADADFLRKMIPHHQQALEIAALAPGRAVNPQLAALAERVSDTQALELGSFRGWLRQHRLGEDLPGYDHATMPGMQSTERMAELAALSGDEFDRRFVEMMTDHHAGAITMANEALRGGENTWVLQTATSVAHEQGVEIDRMAAIIIG
ncbi:uncharacterized protein (DUF305 family) [Catenuloplanes nepalensis]|uniref:Uncharacterized protein (DUF305 family) n=1 Tax=Catenuloplanes nepalensis TaxID=587533 RepID=A0ABT9N2D0_9ACTN|nr:DUF305 domain-containing protein [Catenuloplanes nepalensis]MDP9797849.1 uncharacterized protein (DUF305 family) [Catenuloplanes nepalensis]